MNSEYPPMPVDVMSQIYHRTPSIDSGLTSSHMGILDSRPTTAESQPSPDSQPLTVLNVKFAPLPTLAPRKRRSTVPLGIAARAQLMRRQQAYRNETPAYSASIWSEDSYPPRPKPKPKPATEAPKKTSNNEGDQQLNLGKAVKGASKTLWRRVSQKRSKKNLKSDSTSGNESGSKLDSDNVPPVPSSAVEQTQTMLGLNVVGNGVKGKQEVRDEECVAFECRPDEEDVSGDDDGGSEEVSLGEHGENRGRFEAG